MKRRGRRFPIVIAGVVVVLGAAVVVWWLLSDSKPPLPTSTSTSTSFIREVKPATAPKPVEEAPKVEKKESPPPFIKKPFGVMTSEEKAAAMRYWAKDKKNFIKGLDMRDYQPPPLFSNGVQNAILPYMTPGADVIPMGPISDEKARKAIDKGIVFNFDDPDDILEKKQFVKETLQELDQYMKDGGHAEDYFRKLEDRQNLEHTTLMTVREEVLKFRRDGDEEGAKLALETYNKYLKGKGLPELHMSTSPVRMRPKKDMQQEKSPVQE